MISDPLDLPCGARLSNRLAKAAMTEGLADPRNRATPAHVALYRRWADRGCGLLITGNVQVDRRHLERPANVAIDGAQSNEALAALKAWSDVARESGIQMWVQLNHSGRQTPIAVNPEPLAPSAVKLGLPGRNFGDPRAMTGAEVEDVIARFAHAAAVVRDSGFTGVQVHAAHGYLLSEFLSPRANQRSDAWGGSLANRARLLIETVRAVRDAVGDDFPVSVKLNSADFQKGGFTAEDCLQVVRWLNDLRIDLLEVSGGTYEQPKMAGLDGVLEPVFESGAAASTRAREAYFLGYAAEIRKVASMPLMVTGGFRTRAGMEAALDAGDTDVIGLGRPLCGDPGAAAALLDGRADALPAYEKVLRLGPGLLSQGSPITAIRMINAWGAQGWYCLQLLRMGAGLEPDLRMGVFKAFRGYLASETAAAKALIRD